MIPYIHTPIGTISSYSVAIVIGAFALLLNLCVILRHSKDRVIELTYVIPKIIISGMIGVCFAGLFDAVFKYFEYGVFKIYGITFYGGLIGSMLTFYIQILISKNETKYTIEEWFDILAQPVIAFHFFGRIGCFLAGCCYGKETNSFFGIVFPDNIENGIIHNGIKRLPTQLFEALALVLIFLIVFFVRHRFEVYLTLYAIVRFIIEYFRGDDRGFVSNLVSPAQLISIIIIIFIVLKKIGKRISENKIIN